MGLIRLIGANRDRDSSGQPLLCDRCRAEHPLVWLDQQGLFCWKCYCDVMRAQREAAHAGHASQG